MIWDEDQDIFISFDTSAQNSPCIATQTSIRLAFLTDML